MNVYDKYINCGNSGAPNMIETYYTEIQQWNTSSKAPCFLLLTPGLLRIQQKKQHPINLQQKYLPLGLRLYDVVVTWEVYWKALSCLFHLSTLSRHATSSSADAVWAILLLGFGGIFDWMRTGSHAVRNQETYCGTRRMSTQIGDFNPIKSH